MTLEQQIAQGIEVLKTGGIVAYPTDTLYGLGADAFNEAAVARIFEVKRRPLSMALPLLLANVSWLERVALNVSPAAKILAVRFWPGALTLVLHKAPAVTDIVTAGGRTVAVRVPAHPVPVALMQGLDNPIIGTSANLSGQPSPLNASEVLHQLGNTTDIIIDGGPCPGGIESTIIDATIEPPRLLREGAVSIGQIEKVLNIRLALSR